jgi:alkyl sulfatase BDS1-like metallo-beta-lactamase superfamily hydrolase
MATRVDSAAADGNNYTLNFVTPDTNQQFVIEMSSGTLSNIEGYLSEVADAKITIDREDLEAVIMGQATLEEQLLAGSAIAEGNVQILQSLSSVLINFSPGFEILPGTLR